MVGAFRDRTGGRRRLAQLVSEHGGAVEADLHRYYQTDLLDLWRPGSQLSWRKLAVLIAHLPAESATMTSLRLAAPEVTEAAAEDASPADRPWSQDQMLLAALVDTMRELVWLYMSTHSERKMPHPEPVMRPGIRQKPHKVLTVAAYRALTGQEPPLHLVKGSG